MPSLIALAILAFAFPCVLSFAISPELEVRDTVDVEKLPRCQNHPYEYFPAGVMLPPPKGYADIGRRKVAPPIDPAGQTILCTPGTETFVKMTRKPPNGDMNYDTSRRWIQTELEQLLGNLWTYISREHLDNGNQDGVISKTEDVPNGDRPLGWIFERTSGEGHFKIQIANAHRRDYRPGYPHGTVRIVGNEITWGVLRAALTALGSHMLIDAAGWTECVFEVWDGLNQVGTGRIVRVVPLADTGIP